MYFNLDDVLAVFDEEKDFILSTELVSHFFDPLESNLLASFLILRLEHVA